VGNGRVTCPEQGRRVGVADDAVGGGVHAAADSDVVGPRQGVRPTRSTGSQAHGVDARSGVGVGVGQRQGPADDRAPGVVLHPPHLSTGGVADGHGGTEACPEQSRRVEGCRPCGWQPLG